MCGIAGIFAPSPQEATNLEEKLRRLQTSQRHRGPDDEGLWIAPKGRTGLVHTRLSILDLSPAGHQPMHSPDGRYTISFNGEIYNFRELRAELERDGIFFHSNSDTEVLLTLYAKRGQAMVRDLRGMFAFAIWDEQTQTAFLARDPFGIKPLYFSKASDGSFAFASELSALRAASLCGTALNPAAILRYLRMGTVAEPHTLLLEAQCLPAGTTLEWTPSGTKTTSYWRPQFQPNPAIDRNEAIAHTREALLDSVRHHFISDVPVGIFLSGGIDSTALLALAKETGRSDIATFSVGVDDESLDETGLAQRTAAHFGSRHFETRLNGSQGTECLGRFMDRVDQPSIDGFNSFVVSEFARSEGMKVVLSGLGGDELFGGYPSFAKVPKLFHLGKTIRSIPMLSALAGLAMECFGPSPRSRRLGSFIRHPASMLEAYRCFRGIFPQREARLLTAQICGCDLADINETLPDPSYAAHDERDIVSALELTLYMRHQLLRDSDVMSMSHGLELRVPFVDAPLFEILAQIPAEHRLQPGKQLLLQAVPEVPEWVANQPKRGFVFPFEKWMNEDWKDTFDKIAETLPGPRPTWYQRWAVFMLRQWIG
ncbi:MAG: asparagine synthase (glutamine-hydrolyzing) [Verrucomicrobiaceae bacterium]|nr:asparagine synthase (glutamine-hydrolyzing) [Verrucomicrobiaceae bacterium]